MAKRAVHLLPFILAWATGAAAQFTGDVWTDAFDIAPARPRLGDVVVRTPVPGAELALDAALQGPVTGEVLFTVRVLADGGGEVKRFASAAEVPPSGTVHLSWPWRRPPLWDTHTPERYTLRIQASGPDWTHEIDRPFGFRSVTVEGREILLNGTPVRLRMAHAAWPLAQDAEAIEGRIEAWRSLGFTGAMLPVQEPAAAGRWAEAGDRLGFLLAPGLPAPTAYHPFEVWPPSEWTDGLREILGALRDHPSIIMWWIDGGSLSWADDLHPRRLGRPALEPLPPGWEEETAVSETLVAHVKHLDPGRPVMVRGGGPVGDVYAVDTRLGLHPLRERSEWLSAWAEDGTLPLAAPAFGTPRDLAFSRGRGRTGLARVAEPWLTEYAAAHLGPFAYLRETSAYRGRLGMLNELQSMGLEDLPLRGLLLPGVTPAFHDVQDRFIRTTWRTWRTWGINAGIMPLDDACAWPAPGLPGEGDPMPAGEALREVNRDTLAWIAGPPGAWTAGDHHFLGSETVTRQVVLLNDGRTPLDCRFQCEVTLDGETIRRMERDGRLAPGRRLLEPVTFTVPELHENGDGRIRLEARIGAETHRDVFVFRTYPHPAWGLSHANVLVHDPEGDTRALLARIGIRTEPWSGAPLGERLLVIGRNALRADSLAPAALERFVVDGGRVIICAQHPDWLRSNLGFRVSPHVHRRVWPVASQRENFALAGLDARDLADWRGAGSLVEPFDDLRPTGPPSGRVWHWGNGGSVSSAMIEKPHYGGWTPLLEGGFDLAFSPLLELRRGPGLVLLNLLDLEARGAPDPAADRIMQQLVNYALQSEGRQPPPDAAYVGGDRGRRLLRSMGFIFEDAGRIPPRVRLLVVDGETTLSPTGLEAFVENGGLLVMLAPWPDDLPFRLEREPRTLGGYAPLVNGEICEGLSVSDLHTRLDVQAEVARGPYHVSIGDGIVSRKFYGQRGEAWLVALTPYMLDEHDHSYQRFSRWRLTRALSQVLANLGGRFEVDRRIFAWDRCGREPVSLAGGWLVRAGEVDPLEPDRGAWVPGETGEQAAPFLERPGHGAWLRRDFALPAAWRGYDTVLELGPAHGVKTLLLNGEPLTPDDEGPGLRCRVRAGRLRPGSGNTLLVYAADLGDGAGLTGQADQMRIYIEGEPDAARWYVPGYRTDMESGDDPSRFARWDD